MASMPPEGREHAQSHRGARKGVDPEVEGKGEA